MVFKLQDLEICLFTFNLGEYNNSLFRDYNLLNMDFEKLYKPEDNRIWVITTQEDDKSSIYMDNVIKYFKNTKKYHKLVYFGTNDDTIITQIVSIGASYKNKIVKILIQIPINLMSYITLFNKPILVKHRVFLNKSSLLVNLIIKFNDESAPVLISFMASHLPTDTHEDFILGNGKRIKAMKESISYLLEEQNAFKKLHSNASTHILWTGDMNFRLERYGDIKSDQLRNLISRHILPIKFKDFTPIGKIGATCKTIVDNDYVNSKVKLRKKDCIDVYSGNSKNSRKTRKCYNIFDFNNMNEINKRLNRMHSSVNKNRKSILSKDMLFCKKFINDMDEPITKQSEKCFIKLRTKNSGEKSIIRFPSFCDRIIGSSFTPKGFSKIELLPFYIPELNIDADSRKLPVRPIMSPNFITVSDHNPLIGTFKFISK
jgi:hypothetical protein